MSDMVWMALIGLGGTALGVIGSVIITKLNTKPQLIQIQANKEMNNEILALKKQVEDAERIRQELEFKLQDEITKKQVIVTVKGTKRDHKNNNVFHAIRCLYSEVLQLNLEDKIKESIYKDIILTKCAIWYGILWNFVEVINNQCTGTCENCMKIEDLRELAKDMFDSGMSQYQNYFRNNNEYTNAEKELVAYGMEQFSEFHSPAILIVKRRTEIIDASWIFSKCISEQVHELLNTYAMAFELTKSAISQAINASNGYFKDKEFRAREYPVILNKDSVDEI